jgi:hypothetical protein
MKLIMKKLLPLFFAAACFTPSAFAAEISTINLLNQADFRALSEDMGAALSYKSLMPAEPLGVFGFDLGVAVTATDISKSSDAFSKATGGSTPVTTLYVPTLHAAIGLPFGFDIAASYAAAPNTNVHVVGAELRYALMEGGTAMPAVGIRGSVSSMSGVDQLSFSTKGLDISISKGFAMFTPYAGAGKVWVNSKSNVTLIDASVPDESFSQNKVFLGVNMNIAFVNFLLEADKTGGTQSYSAKLGFRF